MNNTLLIVDSSSRVTRSITRQLTRRFENAWREGHPDARIIRRDVGKNPPTTVTEEWIGAAFTDPAARTSDMRAAIRESDLLIDEIEAADALVIGAPMYNFGMPAQLKAWVDQIVRVGRTFAFDPHAGNPYTPLLKPRPVYVLTSSGDAALQPGGPLAHLNALEPHITTILNFIGLGDPQFIRVGNDEFQDEAHVRTLAAAEAEIDALPSAA